MIFTVSQIVAGTLALEFVVWCLLTYVIKDTPRCPMCGRTFYWSQVSYLAIENIGERPHMMVVKRAAFPCPFCRQIIGIPSYHRSTLWFSYVAFVLGFLVLFFEWAPPNGPLDLYTEYGGALIGALGGTRIVNWFLWRRLEPGAPSMFT